MSECCQIEQKSAADYAREAEERRLAHEGRLNEVAAKRRAEADAANAKNHADKVAELSAQNDTFRASIKPRA